MALKQESPVGSRTASRMSKPTTQQLHTVGTASHVKNLAKSKAIALNEPRHSAPAKMPKGRR